MKVVELCGKDSCCPVVKIAEGHIEIGEPGNLCVLTDAEWAVLKQKVLDGEL